MMKDKNKPKGLALIMPFETQIAIFDDFKARKSYYKKVLKLKKAVNPNAYAVASWDMDENGIRWYSICVPKGCGLGTIVHECSHIVDFICDTHGVPINIENTEIRAYMLGVLFLDVCEVLKIPLPIS